MIEPLPVSTLLNAPAKLISLHFISLVHPINTVRFQTVNEYLVKIVWQNQITIQFVVSIVENIRSKYHVDVEK